jgi:hypothetical protein
MFATYDRNDEKNGIEISFTAKPDAATLEALKSAGFRWHRERRIWYAKQTAERLALAAQIAGGKAPEAAETKAAAPAAQMDRAALASEFAKVWGDGTKMQKYCVGKVAAVAELDDGTLIVIDKQGIEKNFCFGESGYDYDEALDAARHARQSESYFKAENMKAFVDALESIKEAKTLNGRYILTYKKKAYTGQSDDCKIGYIEYKRITEVLEDNGGSAVIAELPGKVMHERGSGAEYRIMTAADIEKVESAYKTAAAAHEKRVETYLKKYGLSNVHAWTYWRDA